tara:strand:+ start:1639 stop:2109 length:471 start_codon:yes stop_codon:yes gene_type:complete
MSQKGKGGFEARHNIDAKKIAKVMSEEIARTLNVSAEAIAGGSSGKQAIGIRSVFKHDSLNSDKPAPKGGPPGVLTGTLRRSFRTRKAKTVGRTIRVAAGTNVLYAKIHEFGLGRMPKRPFMKKGIKSASPFIRKQFSTLGPRIRARLRQEAGPMR